MLEKLWSWVDTAIATACATFPIWAPQLRDWLQLLIAIGGLIYLACRFLVLRAIWMKVKKTDRLTLEDVQEGG